MLCRNEVKNLAAPQTNFLPPGGTVRAHQDDCLVPLVENLVHRPVFEAWFTGQGHDAKRLEECAHIWCRCDRSVSGMVHASQHGNLSSKATRLFAALHSKRV
jgi:hypothetical protein